jgi:(p)ppGpp synthase/HD superfamily hydrolase
METNINKSWTIDTLQDAWYLATKMHGGQKYGGANEGEQIEYLNHIASVVFEVMTAVTSDENLDADLALKCAMLHDAIEDTALTYDDIKGKFGSGVADGVQALTKSPAISGKKDKMLDSLRRIKEQPKEIWAVKMADRICNLYAPPYYWNDEKKREYMDEARLIHSELKEGCRYLADRLLGKISEYDRFLK